MNKKKMMMFGIMSGNSGGGGGADVSGVTATAGDVDEGKIFVDSTGTEVTGTSTYKADYTALNTLVGQTTAVAEDVAQGKVFVNSSGVQTTGTASGGGSEDLVKMIERPANATINIPNGVTVIGNYAFTNYQSLLNINFPNTLLYVEEYSFNNCRGLTSLTFPQSLKGLTRNTSFNNCTALSTVTFLGTPTTISSNAFGGCTNLTTIRVPWAQGAVANSPWGATNASVIYSYQP